MVIARCIGGVFFGAGLGSLIRELNLSPDAGMAVAVLGLGLLLILLTSPVGDD